jgi:hypothetical protein
LQSSTAQTANEAGVFAMRLRSFSARARLFDPDFIGA